MDCKKHLDLEQEDKENINLRNITKSLSKSNMQLDNDSNLRINTPSNTHNEYIDTDTVGFRSPVSSIKKNRRMSHMQKKL
jgi:hypothetical protein